MAVFKHRTHTGSTHSEIHRYLSQPITDHTPPTPTTHSTSPNNTTQQRPDTSEMEDPALVQTNPPYGDTFIKEPHKDIFRLLRQNINGIFANNDFDNGPREIFESFRGKGAGVIALTEPNCDFTNRRCLAAFNKHVKHKTTFRHWAFSSSLANPNQYSTYLPGGTATIIRNHWATRFNESGGDTEMG